TLAGDGVDVDHAAPFRRERLDGIDMRCGVNALELLACRGRRLDQLQPEPVALGHRLLDRSQTPGVFGVAAGVVPERARMSEIDARDEVSHSARIALPR